MVDTVLYTEKLTSERLERILLGGLYTFGLKISISKESLDTLNIGADGGDSDKLRYVNRDLPLTSLSFKHQSYNDINLTKLNIEY